MNAAKSNNRYLLTLKPERGAVQKRVWDGRQPIALGHPFRWILERTDDGVRIRSLGGAIGEAYKNGVQEISHSKMSSGQSVELDGGVIQFFPVKQMPAAYSSEGLLTGELNVFFCLHNCVVATFKLGSEYKGKVDKKKLFTLSRTSDGIKVTAVIEGIEILAKDGNRKIAKGEVVSLTREQMVGTSVAWGSFYWFVRPVSTPKLAGGRIKQLADEETRYFKKAIRNVGMAMFAFLSIALFWPKGEEKKEELVPEQYTKLVMSRPLEKSAEAAAPAAGAKSESKPEPEAQKAAAKVKNTAVVQAFRAKALQNAVSGLLKGGMTHLLAQSENLLGADASKAARRVLDGKAIAGIAAAPVTGLTGTSKVDVAAIGGTGGGNGKGVGYGKGERAGVSGQGKSFVSLDLGNASVEEGLTKEEVGRVIHAHMSEIRYCYESSMLANSDIEGRVFLDFTIGPNGVVKIANVKETTTNDPRLDDCVVRRLTKWQFPKPKGGVNVAVSYPFIFKTLGR